MKTLFERLAQGEILISDGAMGTFLHAKGLAAGECPESWCVSHAEIVRHIAESYAAAGSDIVETNSFGGNSFKLKAYGLADQAATFNRAAARLAKAAIAGRGYVAASVGPTGQMVEEEGGNVTAAQLYESFQEQVVALAEGGADAICVETMWSVQEAAQAIRAVKQNTSLPAICTFTFEPGIKGFRTTMGVKPDRAVRAALERGSRYGGRKLRQRNREHDRDYPADARHCARNADSDPRQRRPAGPRKWRNRVQGDSRIHGFPGCRTDCGGGKRHRWLLRHEPESHCRHGGGGEAAGSKGLNGPRNPRML